MADGFDRAWLIGALARGQEADEACREALLRGATFRVRADHAAPVDDLVVMYQRRVRHLRRKGIRTLGLDSVVERLTGSGVGVVTGASVDDEDYHFVVFLDPGTMQAVSCIAVDAAVGNPGWDRALT